MNIVNTSESVLFTARVNSWKQKLRQSNLSESTIKLYEGIADSKLIPEFRNYQLSKISRDNVAKLIENFRKDSLGAAYLRTIWRVMLSILNDAGNKKINWAFPDCSNEIQKKLEAAIKENEASVLMFLLLRENIPILKLLALRSDDVDENASEIIIRRIITLKENIFYAKHESEIQKISISKESMRLLMAEIRKRSILSKSSGNNNFVFADKNGEFYKPSYYFERFKELSERAGFKVTPKILSSFKYIEETPAPKKCYIKRVSKNASDFTSYCKFELSNMTHINSYERSRLNLMIEKYISSFCSKFTVNQIDDDFKLKFMNYLKDRKCSLSTRESITGFLKKICDLALKKKFIRYNPFLHVYLEADPVVKYHSLSDDEIAKIMKLDSNDINNAFLQVKLLTGTRTAETMGLRWNDILHNNRQIVIRSQLKGNKIPVIIHATKNFRSRKITPPSITFEILSKVRNKTFNNKNNNLGLIFCNEDGSPLSSEFLHKKLRAVTGRNNARLHDLRVTAITVLYKTTKNLLLTARQAGHLDTEVTVKHYVDIVPDLSDVKRTQDKYYKEIQNV